MTEPEVSTSGLVVGVHVTESKIFGPEVTVADDARDQDKLLAYCGRTP